MKNKTNLQKARLTFLAFISGVMASIAQIRTDIPQDNLQILQVNAIGSPLFDSAHTDTEKAAKLDADAKFMQTSYSVHKYMQYVTVVINYLVGDMVESGDESADWNHTSQWVTNNTAACTGCDNDKDIFAGYFRSNGDSGTYGGGAPGNGHVDGRKTLVIDNWSLNHALGHEGQHTFVYTISGITYRALNGDHDQAVDNITFIYTNAGGSSTTYTTGFSNGNILGTSGVRLQHISVDNINNIGNPANGGDGYITRTAPSGAMLQTTYSDLENTTTNSSADVIVDYQNLADKGFRYTPTAEIDIPVVSNPSGDILVVDNQADFADIYRYNTTDPAFQNPDHGTKSNIKIAFYLASATANNQDVLIVPVEDMEAGDNFDMSDHGLDPTQTYIVRAIDFRTNGDSENSAPITAEIPDTEAPNAQTQQYNPQLDASGNATVSFADIDNGTTDNSGSWSVISFSPTNVDCSDVGSITFSYQLTDPSGNTVSGTETGTVIDNTNPTLTTQNITGFVNSSGNYTANPSDFVDTSNDACGIASTTLNTTSFSCSDLGTNTIQVTVTDNNGNATTENATLTVSDNTNPIAQTQNIIVDIQSGAQTITASMIDNGSTDNCGVSSTSIDLDYFDTVGIFNGTFTANDSSGNSDTEPYSVEVINTLAVNDQEIAGFEIYPNPTNSLLNIIATENIKRIALYNSLGQIVLEKQINANETEINMKKLSNGIYILKTYGENKIGIRQIIKE